MERRMNEGLQQKANEVRESLRALAERLRQGDDADLVVWVLQDKLACAHRPLRYHPEFGGSGLDLPPEATQAVQSWVNRIVAAGFRSVICLMHPKEVAHYGELSLDAPDLLAFYRKNVLQVSHRPWEDPKHRPPGEQTSFEEELAHIRGQCLEDFDRLPKPILLHCSAGIDRSSPVAAYLWMYSH